ncbi:tetratricopeptide repeat protein [Winogradskyella immobilis]|uniref:Tetratricopeptide repeat protein n=1 Tax=Winogradskyella immobilis TaxID=2816852 RepID=A0ABS8EJ95_9FLAO|nr:tetratricopeptide repeat protein [Winogradskyella immobilis]MCC1483271.1 tetratricopeptide repeat protein [Winogradskyella immobilis]MCG0015365.1 tetratricopeptide repeat protein [Winogradskyella immobilis]
MKYHVLIVLLLISSFSFAQNTDKAKKKAEKKAVNLVYEANELLENEDYITAEMEYRKAISEQSNNVAGAYNLAHSYYKKGSFDEALFRSQEAAKNAKTKEEKHKAYHGIGNILMKNEKCKEAVEAFKQALRSMPTDEETRYNLALAKECAKQEDGGGEDNKEDENKDKDKEKDKEKKKDDEQKEKDKKEEEGDEDKKKGEDKEDENGKPKDEQKDQGKGDKENKQEKPKPQPGKMSPQQIKNILEAMNNQEQKVQKKINAKKQKGAKVKTEKDW